MNIKVRSRGHIDISTSNFETSYRSINLSLCIPNLSPIFKVERVSVKYSNIIKCHLSYDDICYNCANIADIYINSLYFNPNHKQSRKWWFK